MKINELLNESFDDENGIVDDPDTDKVPHIVMQFKKAIDNGGRSQIVFKDGDKVSIPMELIVDFLNSYDNLKPFEREEVQKNATQSLASFKEQLQKMKSRNPMTAMPKSIYR